MTTNTPQPHFVERLLSERLAAAAGLSLEEASAALRPPPKPDMGDYALPCFELAKKRGMAPPALAQELAGKLQGDASLKDLCEKISGDGPFLNFKIKPGALCAAILEQVRTAGAQWGQSSLGGGKTVVVDYSAPNIAKPFHIGHLMSTILGASLVRIYRDLGYKVVGVNHLGDWGTQCGYQFLAWQKADPNDREKQLSERGLDYLVDLYVDINAPAKKYGEAEKMLEEKATTLTADDKAKLQAEVDKWKPVATDNDLQARALFKKLEDGDSELRALWEKLRTITLKVLQKSYDRLGITFESTDGEGFYEPYIKPMVEDFKTKGVLVLSEGAWVIPLEEPEPPAPPLKEGEKKKEKKKKPPFIVVKSDGATKYETRDLAAALYRKKHYDFVKNLYVVDVRQSEHFSGLFKALEKAGNSWAKDCVHVSYGLMQIKEGDATLPMTTRGGRMIPLHELLDRMVNIVHQIVEEKNPELPAAQKGIVAEAVGIGAVIFWVQSRRKSSNIVFDWKQATSPEGDTGPYVQYTFARACSIQRKAGDVGAVQPADFKQLTQPAEVALCKTLQRLPYVVQNAADNNEPSIITTWLLETARAFNDFYNHCPILKEPRPPIEIQRARLALVQTSCVLMKKGLALIGMKAPEEM